MTETILVINAGSSSIKIAVFDVKNLTLLFQAHLDLFSTPSFFTVKNQRDEIQYQQQYASNNHEDHYQAAIDQLMIWLKLMEQNYHLKAIGHRIVHGGDKYHEPTRINNAILAQLKKYIPLAPLHQPFNLAAIEKLNLFYQKIPQIGCFDTAFHAHHQQCETLFAIPTEFYKKGVKRYGFHGLSYDYIAHHLPDKLGDKIIIAHLGQGASMCALQNKKSIATTMGFSALDGLIMGSRCGNIDPGILLYLLQEKNFSPSQLTHFLYKECGLLGVSGLSADMRTLHQSLEPAAKTAIDLFIYHVKLAMGSLIAALGGLDALIFTAGIGENDAEIREKICHSFRFLGMSIDEQANAHHQTFIQHEKSQIKILVIPTNEELMIAKYTRSLVSE